MTADRADLGSLIVEILKEADGTWDEVTDLWTHQADVLIDRLQLERRIAAAIRSYADVERTALAKISRPPRGSAYEAMRKLGRDAPEIARQAFTEWRGDDE